jgi:putative ABC transport system permease protein
LRDAGVPGQRGVTVANFRYVNEEYWESLGIPFVSGGPFERRGSRGVAVLSRRAAEILWPGQDPTGKLVGGCGSTSSQGLEVVGVVGDVRAGLEKEAPLTVYLPYWTEPLVRPYFVVRTNADPAAISGDMRAAVRSVDPNIAVTGPIALESVVDEAAAVRRFQLNLTTAVAAFGLLLAAFGIYGVISFAVARRTPELGIRLALGARASGLAALVIRQGMVPVLLGLAVGMAGAMVAGRLVSSQLFGVSAHDPSTLLGVGALLIIVGLGACWAPARRAMRINPLAAIRFE